jgi:hypothetical protein
MKIAAAMKTLVFFFLERLNQSCIVVSFFVLFNTEVAVSRRVCLFFFRHPATTAAEFKFITIKKNYFSL